MPDPFPSLTTEDMALAVELLGMDRQDPGDLAHPGVKADLVRDIRRIVREMKGVDAFLSGLLFPDEAATGAAIHPALADFLERAERDCPE